MAAALRGELSRTQARRLYDLGPEVVTTALPAAAKHIATQQTRIAEQNTRRSEQNTRLAELQEQSRRQRPSPSTPSGMVPIYAKPNTQATQEARREERPPRLPQDQAQED